MNEAFDMTMCNVYIHSMQSPDLNSVACIPVVTSVVWCISDTHSLGKSTFSFTFFQSTSKTLHEIFTLYRACSTILCFSALFYRAQLYVSHNHILYDCIWKDLNIYNLICLAFIHLWTAKFVSHFSLLGRAASARWYHTVKNLIEWVIVVSFDKLTRSLIYIL